MHKVRVLSLVCCLTIFGVATSHADSAIGYFNLTCPSGFCEHGLNSPTSGATVGQVIFTLNANGTIAANLEINGPATIWGFAFNTAEDPSESGFTPGSIDIETSWDDVFGGQNDGFASFVTNEAGTQISWTIDGTYTSVYQVLDGGAAQSTVDFFLYDSNKNSYGANAQPYDANPIPEPSSFLLLGTGVLGVLEALRRRLAR